MSYIVKVMKNGVQTHGATFPSKEKADRWIESKIADDTWGKKEQIMLVAEVVAPMKLIEEVKGPMGIKSYKVKIPAEYEVIIEEEGTYGRDGDIAQLIKKRDNILCATDWLFMSDVVTPQKHRRLYVEYRQYLRDLPNKLKTSNSVKLEEFEHWLKRKAPEEFMDGGESKKILHRFLYYVK